MSWEIKAGYVYTCKYTHIYMRIFSYKYIIYIYTCMQTNVDIKSHKHAYIHIFAHIDSYYT